MKTIRILLIEDKISEIENSISNSLSGLYKVRIKSFNNGEEALKYIKENPSPDLVLLDLKIPFYKSDSPQRGNGEKVLRELCQMEVSHIVPTIIITAYPDSYDEPTSFGRKYEIYAYLDKSEPKFYTRLKTYVQEIIDGEIKHRNRFCSIANKICSRDVKFKGRNSCFLAYSSEGRYAGFMKDLKAKIKSKRIDALDWIDKDRESDAPSGLIFCPFLCDRIFSRNIFIANITDKNLNVYFEWGFAIAIGRKSYALCEQSKLKSLPPLLKGNLCIPYQNVDISEDFIFEDYLGNLYGKVTDIFPAVTVPSKNDIKILGIFPNDNYHEGYISDKLKEFIKELKLLHLGKVNDIIHVLNTVLLAEKIMFDLMSDEEENSMNNAQLAFLIGFAIGRGKDVFILQQRPINKPFLDTYSKLKYYSDIEEIKSELKEWSYR